MLDFSTLFTLTLYFSLFLPVVSWFNGREKVLTMLMGILDSVK